MTVFFPFVDIFMGDPYYDTGTVSLTQDDATLQGSGTSWSGSDIDSGSMIMVGRETSRTPLFVSSVTNDTNLEMTSQWKGSNASGLSYIIDDPSSSNWRLRIFPTMRQFSGKSGSIVTVIPLEAGSGAYAKASAMPLENAKFKYHIDGQIYIDSINKPSASDNIEDLIDAIQELQTYNGILGMRWYNKLLQGGSGNEGVIIDQFTCKDKMITRSVDTDEWHTGIQIDLIPCEEF